MTKNIMIVGVGGQGTLLASRVLGNTVINEGYDVKVSEVHGMSQRGGSVVTYVKYGEKVYSPIIDKGEADVILAFELLEAYRALPYLKKGGKMIVNAQQIDPMPVITGAAQYPADIAQKLADVCDVTTVDALTLAKQAGNQKARSPMKNGWRRSRPPFPPNSWRSTSRRSSWAISCNFPIKGILDLRRRIIYARALLSKRDRDHAG